MANSNIKNEITKYYYIHIYLFIFNRKSQIKQLTKTFLNKLTIATFTNTSFCSFPFRLFFFISFRLLSYVNAWVNFITMPITCVYLVCISKLKTRNTKITGLIAPMAGVMPGGAIMLPGPPMMPMIPRFR